MALKILDNFVLSIPGLRFHHRIQELRQTDGVRPLSRGSAPGDPTLAVTTITAIPRNTQHRYATLARPLSKRRDGHHKKALLTTAGRDTTHVSNHRHRRLLRACRERPSRRAAEQRDELAPSHHSITSSARASSVGGTSRPSALAVLRLITSSYLVGACTGSSAGFSPLRMRST